MTVRSALLLLLCGMFLMACTQTPSRPAPLVLPTPQALQGPPIPFHNPNLLAKSETHIRPIEDIAALLSCLDAGQTVYGIALQNSNVRNAPTVDACRIGRIPRGSLVEVVGAIEVDEPVVAEPAPANTRVSFTLGFVEDVQPIFRRTCNSCHSAVVKNVGLQVTEYGPLMRGGVNGAVVLPGDAENSRLWEQVDTGKMPLIGELSPEEKRLIRNWIDAGAPERRLMMAETVVETAPSSPSSTEPAPTTLWLQVDGTNVASVADTCVEPAGVDRVISSDLLFPLSCGVAPRMAELQTALRSLSIAMPAPVGTTNPVAGFTASAGVRVALPAEMFEATAPVIEPAAPPPGRTVDPSQTGIQAAAFNLPPVSDADGWLQPRGGFCVDQRLPQNNRGITALAFAPDGQLFMALDQSLTDNPDPLILYDAHHPSRSVAVYDPVANTRPVEIFDESTRITGMTYYGGALYIARAGEVGRIPDGGRYEPLAGGFAVNSQLFHANNGIAVADGWVYVAAGGVIDGWSDGPIEGIGEAGAQNVAAGGNRFAARIVRAPLDALLGQRSIEAFQTVARGVRNPYGITADPAGRLWFTDNGATNVPENVSAGDEVNLLDPRTVAPGTPEDATPYYGFPLALTGAADWYTPPVVDLPNTAAPTSITWAYGTLFFGVYGRDPGLYRLGRTTSGALVAERVVLAWPVLAVTTAPDGALWMGTGSGGLFRITPGCG
ncbi:MAG: hypothetical protein KJZ93_21300 [Caldilineaceae bacterium]|nr:hypothetical protein [Caldilineaceae bacterium]